MGGDRFIPTRNSKQMDVASFLLSKENEPVDSNNTAASSVSYVAIPSHRCYVLYIWLETQTCLSFKGKPESLVHVSEWIQHWRCKDLAPGREAAECSWGYVYFVRMSHEDFDRWHSLIFFLPMSVLKGYQNNLKVLYSQAMTPASVKKTRYISSTPDRILDAPELRNDFCKFYSICTSHSVTAIRVCFWSFHTHPLKVNINQYHDYMSFHMGIWPWCKRVHH